MIISACIGILLICTLAGCTDPDKAQVAETQEADLPTFVRNANLLNYWEVQNTKFAFELSDVASPAQSGQVEVGFIIDSNGQTSGFEIVKSVPDGLWDKQALKGAKQLKFTRADGYTVSEDIYTTWQFDFNATSRQ
jgi:TonB family protein